VVFLIFQKGRRNNSIKISQVNSFLKIVGTELFQQVGNLPMTPVIL